MIQKGLHYSFCRKKQQQPLEIITLRQISKQSVAHTNILPSTSLWEERDCCCIYPSGRANEGRGLERRKWERVRNKMGLGEKEWEEEMAGFPIQDQSVLSSLAWTCQKAWTGVPLLALSLCNFSREEWMCIHLDLLVRPSICQGVINYEKGQQQIKPETLLNEIIITVLHKDLPSLLPPRQRSLYF